jgi:hypothetical protein
MKIWLGAVVIKNRIFRMPGVQGSCGWAGWCGEDCCERLAGRSPRLEQVSCSTSTVPLIFVPGCRIKFSMRSRIKHFWSMLIRSRFFDQKSEKYQKNVCSKFVE